MVQLQLSSALARLTEGQARMLLPGHTVGEVLRAVESEHPAIRGWILDEQGQVRRHVNVFVNGERKSLDDPVEDRDEVFVLPAISGG